MNFNYKLGVIGYGNMSSAIIDGILKSKLISKKEIIISDIDDTKIKQLKAEGFNAIKDNVEIIKNANFILLAIKPQFAVEILNGFKDSVNDNIFISIMAGITINSIMTILDKKVKVARCMPNTPCKLGMGMSCLDVSALNSSEKNFVKDIFASTGKVLEVREEQLHAVTSISGSGPAYVYYFINAMIKAGIDKGLSFNDSKTLTLQTFLGATKMIEHTNFNIDDLIDMVCSKGGTTIAAVDYFNNNGLDNIIAEGINKCFRRSIELSKSGE